MAAILNTLRDFCQHDTFNDNITYSVDNLGMSFGKRLSLARKNLKLTQPELARLCGWESQSRISMYERDQREPSNRELVRLADILGVTIDWLLRDTKEGLNTDDLPPHALQLARLIAQAPPEKVKAILTLLQVKENGTHQQSPKETPSTQPSPQNKERRSGQDRRHNVHQVDFERRSGRDRRAGAFVMIDREGKLKSPKKNKTKKKEKGDRDE